MGGAEGVQAVLSLRIQDGEGGKKKTHRSFFTSFKFHIITE